MLENYANGALDTYNQDNNGNTVPDRSDSAGTLESSSSLDTGNMQINIGGEEAEAINSEIDKIVAGLGCGFGGGSCLSLPLNWAPLAPGSAPTAFGFPLGPLSATTGVPVFAFPTICPPGKWVWPSCPIGAGGYLGPANISQIRLFITPTITGAIGTAICFGPNYILGQLGIPKGVSPLVPGGNCIVAAAPLAMCKDDGSDGNAASLGYSNFINANSCTTGITSSSYTASELATLVQYATTGKNAIQAGTIAGGKSTMNGIGV